MAEKLDPGQIKFRIVGTAAHSDRVLADVFARKLRILVQAVAAADVAFNGGKRFDYVIVNLNANSPATALIGEQQVSFVPPQYSGVQVFGRCLESVSSGHFAFAREYRTCALKLQALAKEAEEKFEVAEITVGDRPTVIVDQTFFKKATEAVERREPLPEMKLFKGSAIGTFDGTILETDLRGSSPKVIIRLAAGGKEIPCVCPGLTVEDIRPVLNKRVRLTGKATYDGRSALPTLIEVLSAPEQVRAGADFSRWRGSFKPFTIDPWSDEI